MPVSFAQVCPLSVGGPDFAFDCGVEELSRYLQRFASVITAQRRLKAGSPSSIASKYSGKQEKTEKTEKGISGFQQGAMAHAGHLPVRNCEPAATGPSLGSLPRFPLLPPV